jgi:hypothetical protein
MRLALELPLQSLPRRLLLSLLVAPRRQEVVTLQEVADTIPEAVQEVRTRIPVRHRMARKNPPLNRRSVSIFLPIIHLIDLCHLLVEGSRGRGRGRGGDRGDRGERGERGERGGGRGGRRPFDRHSQTGKTCVMPDIVGSITHSSRRDSEKKIHQGWGGDDGKEEFKTEQAATVDAAAEGDAWGGGETNAADWGTAAESAPAETATAPAAEEEKPESRPRKEREEEEDHTLTLEQYLAQQKEKDALVPKLDNTRKANEGADENIWKNTVPLTRDEEKETYFVGKARHT